MHPLQHIATKIPPARPGLPAPFGIVLAILFAAPLLTGCTPVETPSPETPVPDTATSTAALPSEMDSMAPQADTISPCTAGQLSIASVFKDAGAGNRAVVFAFTNDGPSDCTMTGYPGIALIDSTGTSIPEVDIVESENAYFQAEQATEEVHLAPGQQASFQIAFGAVETEGETCVDAAGLAVTSPGGSDTLHVREPLYRICTGELRVMPVIPGIPQF